MATFQDLRDIPCTCMLTVDDVLEQGRTVNRNENDL
jgi:hypothetical protein